MEKQERNKMAAEIADSISDFLRGYIETILSPTTILTYAASMHGKPIITYNNTFKESEGDSSCVYGVYADKDKLHSTCKPAELMTMEQVCNSGELFGVDVDDYLSAHSNPLVKGDYENVALRFSNHFLNAIGLDYEGLKKNVVAELAKCIVKSIPYKDIIKAYPMEELGEYHEDYDGQEYIDDCRKKYMSM